MSLTNGKDSSLLSEWLCKDEQFRIEEVLIE
jgi:hypothetical protein